MCVLRKSSCGVAFAFILAAAGAATADSFTHLAPPREQIFTPLRAADWTSFRLAGNAGGSFSEAFSAKPLASPLMGFRPRGSSSANGAQMNYGVGSNSATVSPAGEATKSGTEDRDGRQTLGVNIARVGSTPTKVRQFLAALPADAASKVRTGCTSVMAEPEKFRSALLKFCSALPQRSVSLP